MMAPLELTTSGRGARRRLLLIGLAAAALVLAGTLIAWQLVPGEDPTVVKLPSEYRFRCTRCDHRWSADKAGVTQYFGGGQPTTLAPVDCPSCPAKRAAFLMFRCPWCGEHYIHARLLKGEAKRPKDRIKEDICPHCGKDTLKWRR